MALSDQLKQRLVGAIVLVALAVIFVPMLLEGDKRSGIPVFGSNVPEKPELKTGVVDIPLEMPPSPPQEPVNAVEAPVETGTAAPKPEPKATTPTTAPAPKPAPAPAPVQAVKPAEIPPAPKAVAGTEAWAVQVGSFSDSRNALKLRDSLRAKGYPAFVEQVKVSTGSSYRVRVGPVLARADAEAIQAKLAAKVKLSGIVVHHP